MPPKMPLKLFIVGTQGKTIARKRASLPARDIKAVVSNINTASKQQASNKVRRIQEKHHSEVLQINANNSAFGSMGIDSIF